MSRHLSRSADPDHRRQQRRPARTDPTEKRSPSGGRRGARETPPRRNRTCHPDGQRSDANHPSLEERCRSDRHRDDIGGRDWPGGARGAISSGTADRARSGEARAATGGAPTIATETEDATREPPCRVFGCGAGSGTGADAAPRRRRPGHHLATRRPTGDVTRAYNRDNQAGK